MPSSRLAILFLILVIAAVFRFVGIRFGEPLGVHPDEHNLVFHAMEAGANAGDPGWFEYPSGMIYITLALQGLHYLTGNSPSPADFWREFTQDPFPYYLWVRWFVAACGVLGVFAVWLLGREWDRGRDSMRFLGWGAAALMAVHFLHMRDSHFATTDIPLTTAITFALWLLLREFHRERTSIIRLLLVAVFVGFCCGIKYTAAPLVFPLLYVGFANAMRDERFPISAAWMFGSASVLLVSVFAGFVLTTPYAAIDPTQFWSDIGYQFFTSRGHTPIYGGGHALFLGYIEGPWMWGGGHLLAVLSFFGLMMAVLRLHPEDKVLLWYAIPYFILIALLSRVWGRWFLPLVPLQLLWAVRFLAVYAVHPWVVEFAGPGLRKAVVVGIVVIMGLETGIPGLRLLSLLREKDTRVAARDQIAEELRPGEKVWVTPFCPPIPGNVIKQSEDGLLNDREAYSDDRLYDPSMPSYDAVVAEGVSAVVMSSFYWDAVSQDFVIDAYPGAQTYREFKSQLDLDADAILELRAASEKIPFHPENIYAPTFNLFRWQRPGPDIALYRLPPPSTR